MKRTWFLVIGGVALVVLLGGAAFVGGRLLNGQTQPQGSGPVLTMGTDGKAQQKVQLNIEQDSRLPQTPVDVRGIYLRRADSSIFVGTGQVSIQAQKTQDGNVTMASSHDGPDVEVVVTHDTAIYRDVTLQQFNGPPPSGQQIKQVLEAGSLDELGENSTLSVWGTRSGDRVVANVLVYTLPAILSKGQGSGR